MTMKKATEIVIGIRLWSCLASFIYLLITDNAMCVTEPVPTCASFKSSNYVWFLIQNLVLYGVCIFVTVYVIKTFLRIQSTVVPVVNLPVQCQIKTSPKQENINSVRLVDLEQGSSRDHPEPIRQVPSVSSKVKNVDAIQRLNSDPAIFIRLPPPAPPTTCLIPPTLVNNLGRVKKVLMATLQAGCFVLLLASNEHPPFLLLLLRRLL